MFNSPHHKDEPKQPPAESVPVNPLTPDIITLLQHHNLLSLTEREASDLMI